MKYTILLFFLITFTSCGYPDIDSVPDFNDIKLTNEEILDYCSNINSNKKDMDKCINDYKSKN